MKNIKKFLSVLLALCLLTAFLPTVAFAEGSAYAVYNDADKTLTFCVGTPGDGCIVRDNGEEVPGTAFYTDFLNGGQPWSAYASVIETVRFSDALSPTATNEWFSGFSRLTQIDNLEKLDTANVTAMNGMFYNCTSLTSLDLSTFEAGNVVHIGSMLNGCTSLSSLTIGPSFHFGATYYTEEWGAIDSFTFLETPQNENYTGYWVLLGSDAYRFEPYNFAYGFNNGAWAGTWVWERNLSNAAVTVADQIYTGNPLRPAVTVNWNGETLTEGTDYTVDYDNNINVGTATVTVTGKGVYFGTPTQTFAITEDISDATVTVAGEVYTGEELRPAVTVTLGDKTLTEGTDYTVDYDNNINVGTATVTVTGIGNYCGTATKTFAITNDISGATVTVVGEVYTGEEIRPPVTVTFGDETLTEGTDFTVDYDNNIYSGIATVTVTGIGAYSGTVTQTFIIYSDIPNMYAVYNSENQTFTFCYGVRNETSVIRSNGGDVIPGDMFFADFEDYYYGSDYIPWRDIRYNVRTVIFLDEIAPTITDYWFYDFGQLEQIVNIENLKTDNVISMHSMFDSCSDLRSLDLSHFKTGLATDMGSMFRDCSTLTSLDLSGFDTREVTNMSEMFLECYSLTSLDLSGFNTTNVTDMSKMFKRCTSLRALDLTHFDTCEVTNMADMFFECASLTSLDLSSFNTKKVTDMSGMFEIDKYDSSLVSVDVSSFDTGSVTTMCCMFSGCNNLTSLDVSGFNTANVEDMSCMFDYCELLTEIDVSHFNTAKVEDMSYMFEGCTALTSLDLSGFDTRPLKAANGSVDCMLAECNHLSSLKLGPYFCFWSEYEEKGEIEILYAELPEPPTADPYTGRWIRVDGSAPYSSLALMEDYDGRDTMVGTWVWEGSVLPTDISGATVTVAPQTFTGEALTPAVTVTLGETTLIQDMDYTVAYANNTAIGTATVTVTGIGGYRGTVTKTFAITAYVPDIADAAVTVEDQTYTGKALRPAVTVTLGDTALTEGTDFFVTYTNNINVGTATVTVFGMGGYTGSATAAFAIKAPAADISGADVRVSDQTYTGAALRPAVTVTLDDEILTEGTDYHVTYRDNIEIGTATVTVFGLGKYSGRTSKTFLIKAPTADISAAAVTVADQFHTGKALRPAVTVTLGGKTLTEGTDYYVIYANNTDVGTATVTVTGIGGYRGTATKTFAIIDHSAHTWGEEKVTKAATCKETGERTFTCTVCGVTKTEMLAKTSDHVWDAGKVTKAATCKEAGVKTFTCTVCGNTKTEPIAKTTDHTWDAGKVTKAATCREAGVKTFTCTVCGDTKTEPIAKTSDHTWDAGKVTKAATCKEAGVKTFTCTVCGDTKTEPIAKTSDHTWDAGKVTKAATCKETGERTFTCTVCGDTKTEPIAKTTDHTWDAGKVTKAATCKEAGVKTFTCTVCGDTKTEPIAKTTDHAWDAGKVTKEATAEAAGEKTYTCTVCGGTKTETIPQKPAENPVIPGDVDGNGRVDAADARYALRAAVGLDDTAEGLDFSSETNRCFLAADVTKDGKILAEDARLILRAAVGLETLA